MCRKTFFAVPILCLALLPALPHAALADERGANEVFVSKERAHNAGSVDGEVVSVDRAHGTMIVQSSKARYNVTVLPSTTIRGRGAGFYGIADIERGQHVQVFMSRRDDVYYAQIIHLRDER